MGMIRKAMSITTLGAVDLRSDKERIALNTRRTKRAVKAQTRAIKRLSKNTDAANVNDSRYALPGETHKQTMRRIAAEVRAEVKSKSQTR